MKTQEKQKIMIDVINIQSFYLDEGARNNLKNIIKEKNLSQRKIAEIAEGKISYGFIKMVLSGQTSTISKDKLMVICQVLKINPNDVFSNSVKFTMA